MHPTLTENRYIFTTLLRDSGFPSNAESGRSIRISLSRRRSRRRGGGINKIGNLNRGTLERDPRDFLGDRRQFNGSLLNYARPGFVRRLRRLNFLYLGHVSVSTMGPVAPIQNLQGKSASGPAAVAGPGEECRVGAYISMYMIYITYNTYTHIYIYMYVHVYMYIYIIYRAPSVPFVPSSGRRSPREITALTHTRRTRLSLVPPCQTAGGQERIAKRPNH